MFEKNDKKQETPQRNLRRFLYWGEPKKEHFVLRDRTLRFIFSERFVLRIIVLFFLLHVSQDNLRIDTLIMGAVLCVFYLKTNDIRYCIIVHSIANLIAVIAPYIKG
jgi:hypothetical protein